MAVEIQLDLDASEATGKIGAVAASLEGLERVANDIDIDFDADVSDITEEIQNFADALDSIDTGNLGFVEDLDNVADKLDDALDQEIDVNVGGGDTNSGDSTGSDPPISIDSGFLEAAKKVGPTADGGETAGPLQRRYGEHTYMPKKLAGKLHGLGSNRDGSNLGASSPFFQSGLAGRIGTNTGFGNDPVSMDWRRQFASESRDDILNGADPSDGKTKRFDTLEDRIRNFRQHAVNMVEGFSQQMEKRDEAATPIETPFGDNGLNYGKRAGKNAQLDADELKDLMENPAQSIDGFLGEDSNKSNPLVEQMADAQAKAKLDALKTEGLHRNNFRSLNEDIRQTTYSWADESDSTVSSLLNIPNGDEGYISNEDGVPETDAEIGAATGRQGRGFGDFDASLARNDSRSNREIIEGNSILSRLDEIKSKGDVFGALNDGTDRFGKKLRKLKPTMGKYMQLMAAILPVALALGVQLAGVAAAMGSVAAAGGALIGLGLLGHGESMAGSFAQAKAELRGLKREMFQMAQPTMQQFAPIQSRAFDAAPEALGDVFEQMEGLTAYEDTLFQLGGALAGGMEQAVEIVVENEKAISQLTTRFGGLIGAGVLKFFEWLIQAASRNQELLVQLGRSMLKLAVAAYNVSMAIARVLGGLSPLFNILVFISQLLNSQLIVNLMVMVSWLFVLGKAAGLVYALAGGFMTLATGLADAALMMFGYEMSTWGAVAATMALVGAIGLLTLGAATVIGGAVTGSVMSQQPGASPSDAGASYGGGGGGKQVYNDNRSFTINQQGSDYASQKATEDTVKRVNQTSDAQSLPPVTTSSDNSTGSN